jgi:tetratricopeptide (TPR) repeat protein
VSVKTKWFAVAVIIIVSAVCLWRGAHAYARYKEQRLTARTRLFLQDGRDKEAFLTAQQILGANPANVDACRFMAELTERAKDPSTLIWRRRVAELSPALENRLALAAAALLFERPPCPLARQTLEGIKARHEETVAYHVIAAQLALKLNRLEDAETHYQKAIILEPGKESHQLNLAVLRLQSKEPSVVATARATLERLAASPRFRIYALRSLVTASLEKEDVETAIPFSEQLLAHPQCAFGDRVQHLTLLHSSHSPTFDAWLSTVRNEASTNELQVYQLSA